MAGTSSLMSRCAALRTAVALLAAVLLAVGVGLVGVVATPDAAHASVLFATDLEPTPSDGGYWIVDAAGHVFAHGDAAYLGGWGALQPGESVTALSRTSTGKGYWLFSSKGRVSAFGDATLYGDMSATVLNGPVLGSIPTSSGRGYYMVASDGGIFAFGDAQFYGSMGATPLNAPVRGLVPTASGLGYWLVASDGGIFAFGDAQFGGSMGSVRLNRPVVGMVRYGNGYLMVASDGGIFAFSDQPFLGSLGAKPPAIPIVSVAATNASPGYWMLDGAGTVYPFGAAWNASATATDWSFCQPGLTGKTTANIGLDVKVNLDGYLYVMNPWKKREGMRPMILREGPYNPGQCELTVFIPIGTGPNQVNPVTPEHNKVYSDRVVYDRNGAPITGWTDSQSSVHVRLSGTATTQYDVLNGLSGTDTIIITSIEAVG